MSGFESAGESAGGDPLVRCESLRILSIQLFAKRSVIGVDF
jgi:hypothetical protein